MSERKEGRKGREEGREGGRDGGRVIEARLHFKCRKEN